MRLVELGEVATIDRESIVASGIRSGTKYLGLENVYSDGSSVPVDVDEGELLSNKFVFGPKHLLYGKLRPYLNKITLPDFEGICSTDIIPILPDANKLDKRYLYYYLRTPWMIETAVKACSGANLPRVDPKLLAKFKIPLPPLPEQRRIAAILDKAQALVANDKRTLAVFDQLAKSLFLEMFGDPVRNERGWEKHGLAELCQSIVVGFVGACEQYYTGPDGIPMVRTGNLREGHLDFHNLKFVTREFHLRQRKSQLRKGDILIARHGDNGKASLYDGRFQEANSLNIVVLRPDKSKMLPQFLITVMNDQSMRTYIASRTGGATQKVVNTKEIQKLEFIAPSLSDQEEFVGRFDKLIAHRSQAEQSLRQSEALFGSLLQRAFAGGFGG
jgi:type I restriction enzyme S subunit